MLPVKTCKPFKPLKTSALEMPGIFTVELIGDFYIREKEL